MRRDRRTQRRRQVDAAPMPQRARAVRRGRHRHRGLLTRRRGAGGRARGLRVLREAVGMVFQEFHLFPHLDGARERRAGPAPRRRKRARGRRETAGRELLARVGSWPIARPVVSFRAVSWAVQEAAGRDRARVLMAMPLRVLLLDEPTSALDREMREEVRDVIHSALARERASTMVLVTHETRLASELSADRVWVMREGRIAAQGLPRGGPRRRSLAITPRRGSRQARPAPRPPSGRGRSTRGPPARGARAASEPARA